ncbi:MULTISPECIES: LacI family DNA-binding transcriptional regulator [Carnobacterium]|jgi:LacI family transcriptional regulator|uniref:LacI family DNA-binding transcriptional regulator n=1 Tax=Carnobacterium TaxID=2747 RepID=UPI00026C8D87|nr:LacI family DNA-binding transcriptional regulator [Carnobacterium maltaromaticum]AOA03433.1 LacI family transcriptional regulator [Carnobacterium maltaromaticum]KRN63977.1 LacI family sugar-binding transcriptional regulator [Carnobacterium maltaromaticum DSM 20342]KRN71423.1 LacI family sugar-binding transcriptional regulator [Carnobacterium maltaromaticum]MBC9809811.1 LacI family DNA-binding transcriptional regulator [Carnobacterium maltaromaticum]MCI1819913.1 LacI family DNA-binding trans
MKATMKDVAKLAGVGVGTVSRVINGVRVKDSTLKKVNQSIQELGYEPDIYARGMKTNRSNTIALIVPTIWHPFFSEFGFHVEKELKALGYKIFLCNSTGDPAVEDEYIQMIKQNKVDGIIGITYTDIDKSVSSDIPFVSIDRHFTSKVTIVAADSKQGGEIAFNELNKRGCQHFAFVGTHQDKESETKNRRIYFEKSARRAGKKISILDFEEPIIDFENQVQKFFIDNPTIDGLFGINDFLAMDVMKELEKLGKRIPEDIQVIGFDGVKLSEEREYLMTTIRQPLETMAKVAVEQIMNAINGDPIDYKTIIPVTFIEGNTTKN